MTSDGGTEIVPGTVVDLTNEVLGLRADGVASLMVSSGGGRPKRLEGHTIGLGEALVVPRGVWHLIDCVEPGQMINITPGSGGEHRPLPAAD